MQTTATPIINNQPVTGSNKTINIPNPKPIRQTANVFLNILHNLLPPFLYIIFFTLLFVPNYVTYNCNNLTLT